MAITNGWFCAFSYHMRIDRYVAPLLFGMAALGLFAACAAAATGAAHSPSPSPSSTPTTATTQMTPGQSPSATGPSPSSTSIVAGGCATSQLTVALGPSNGTAGAIYYPVQFTNKTAASCTLYGFPGVSFAAGTDEHQVGAAASRTQQTPATITVMPRATASALLRVTDSGVYGCTRVQVNGLRIYPPGNTESVIVSYSGMACTSDVQQLTVGTVVTGSSGQ